MRQSLAPQTLNINKLKISAPSRHSQVPRQIPALDRKSISETVNKMWPPSSSNLNRDILFARLRTHMGLFSTLKWSALSVSSWEWRRSTAAGFVDVTLSNSQLSAISIISTSVPTSENEKARSNTVHRHNFQSPDRHVHPGNCNADGTFIVTGCFIV